MVTKGLSLFIILQCIFVLVSGHSWVDCINVANPKDITTLANMQCTGYPANYVGRSNPDANMYKVEGIALSAWPSTPCCKSTSRTYSTTYPMYVVPAGGTMTLGYTPNGHTSWMSPPPRYGSQNYTVYWTPSAPGETRMVTMADMVLADVLAQTLFETPCHDRNTGAQLDPSAGLCAAPITIPANTRPGVYQMVWYWPFRFQGPSIVEDYLTCFDVQVTAAGPTTAPITTTTTTTTTPPTTTTTTTTQSPTTPTTTTTTTQTPTTTPTTTTTTTTTPTTPTTPTTTPTTTTQNPNPTTPTTTPTKTPTAAPPTTGTVAPAATTGTVAPTPPGATTGSSTGGQATPVYISTFDLSGDIKSFITIQPTFIAQFATELGVPPSRIVVVTTPDVKGAGTFRVQATITTTPADKLTLSATNKAANNMVDYLENNFFTLLSTSTFTKGTSSGSTTGPDSLVGSAFTTFPNIVVMLLVVLVLSL